MSEVLLLNKHSMDASFTHYLLKTYPMEELTSLDKFGYGWIHSCIFNNDLSTLKILLNNGFDYKQKTSRGETCLDIAYRLGRWEIVKYLEGLYEGVNHKFAL